MFSHTETFVLFALAVAQGVLVSGTIQRSTGWPLVLTLAVGCAIGFILASIELTVFHRMFKKNR